MLEITLAQTLEEREEIFKLRYQIYVEELGWFENCPNYEPNHQQKKVEDPLDLSANLFMALDRNELVGTIRCNYTKNLDLENLDIDYYTKLYQMEKVGDAHPLHTSITGRFMVQSNFRRNGIGLRIMEALYKQQLLDGIKFDFIDAEAYLVPFFEKLGYQTIDKIDYQMYESSVLMVLDIPNIKHHEQVK
ncbi:MAG: GNAT family N-acetyltransferase [Okeania sp. SIO2D1]|nr:GNAT family N-acetyltransferase [Okeania sp. SIO2D1]